MKRTVSRRSFVKIASFTGIGIASAAAATSAHLPTKAERQSTVAVQASASGQIPYAFFTEPETAFVEAAVDQLIPSDEVGPGALELNVAHYIDAQLTGAYGNGERLYLEGPFQQGTETQGYQLPLRPSEIYRIAIADIDTYCRTAFNGKRFAELSGRDRDRVLTNLEQGKVSLNSLPAQLFFQILHQNTLEGYFSDPIYGGNKGMGSWRMLGFPGAHHNFRADVGKPERVVRLPISLSEVMSQPQA